MYQALYSSYRRANPTRLHFAAHSHHPWPDVTAAAQQEYWSDSMALLDRKWDRILGEVLEEVQNGLARLLGSSTPRQIAFAPNTHEFVVRLLSCIENRPAKVLSSDSEFHSFRRQAYRLKEASELELTEIPLEPFGSFVERYKEALQSGNFDMSFVSHVFFTTGYALSDGELLAIAKAAKAAGTLSVFDGYHALAARPVSVAELLKSSFYLGGSYKYLQAGEGVCFLSVPEGCELRPKNTGWFADFSGLENSASDETVGYSSDGFRFFGSTFDGTALYRLRSVLRLFQSEGISAEEIHSYVTTLQGHFIENMDRAEIPWMKRSRVKVHEINQHGHFFSLEHENASDVVKALESLEITTDSRGNLLRFGFGMYQSLEDIDALFARMRENKEALSAL